MSDRTFKYSPALPLIKAFHDDSISFYKLLIGCLGQGKTMAALAELLYRAATAAPSPDGIRRTRFLVTRSSFSQLKTTTIQTYRSLVGGDAGGRIVIGDSPIQQKLVFGDVESEWLFMPCESDADVERFLSLEVTAGLISEWTTAPQSAVQMIAARVGRYPSTAQGQARPNWSGIILEGHMPEPDTWQSQMLANASVNRPVKDGIAGYILPPALVKVGGRWVGNPEPGALNPHLPDTYYSRLILDQPEDFIRRFCANEMVYTSHGRAVFAGVYSDSVHCLPDAYEPDPNVPITIGLDPDLYGSAVLCQWLPGGRCIVFDEVYSNEAGIAALGQALVQLVAHKYSGCIVSHGWTDPSAGTRGVNNQTALGILRANTPWRWAPAPLPKNDLASRLEVCRHVLRTLGDGGKPLLQISPRCKVLRAALAGRYRFRETKTGGSVIVSDTPVKDDFATVAEALQYALLGGGIGGVVQGKVRKQQRPPGQVYIADQGWQPE